MLDGVGDEKRFDTRFCGMTVCDDDMNAAYEEMRGKMKGKCVECKHF